ncbi:MAG: hypothetical protein ACYCW6_18800 [Candidatus Xenobia bacterium]
MFRFHRALIVIAFAAAAFGFQVHQGWADNEIDTKYADLIKHIKKSVVLITTYNDKGDKYEQGSGFFVAPGFSYLKSTNYPAAFDMLTTTTQDRMVKNAAYEFSLQESDARAALKDSQDPHAIWAHMATPASLDRTLSGSFVVDYEEDDNAAVKIYTTPGKPPVTYLLHKENGQWKVGLAESTDARKK